MTCETFDRDWIEKERMGAFLSVAKGSDEEPKFLKLEYNGPTKGNGKTVCLVGKGVTFDAGGISLKVKTGSLGKLKFFWFSNSWVN